MSVIAKRCVDDPAVTPLELMRLLSYVDKRRVEVRILTTRVEWAHPGQHAVTQILPLTAISTVVATRSRLGRWCVAVTGHVDTVEFRAERADVEQATELLIDLVGQRQQAERPAARTTNAPRVLKGSIPDELDNLKWLLDIGVLTQPEFLEERDRLLLF